MGFGLPHRERCGECEHNRWHLRTCGVCSRRVCSTCHVVQRVDIGGGEIMRRKLCNSCWGEEATSLHQAEMVHVMRRASSTPRVGAAPLDGEASPDARRLIQTAEQQIAAKRSMSISQDARQLISTAEGLAVRGATSPKRGKKHTGQDDGSPKRPHRHSLGLLPVVPPEKKSAKLDRPGFASTLAPPSPARSPFARASRTPAG